MDIQKRIEELKSELGNFSSWEEKYKHIIDLGKAMPELSDEEKRDEFKVKGCQSQVWLIPGLEGDKVVFKADSDASIVKGIIAILLRIYSNSTPAEILGVKPDFVDEIGLRQHLSMSRANGLNSMLKQISMYAIAYSHKIQAGL